MFVPVWNYLNRRYVATDVLFWSALTVSSILLCATIVMNLFNGRNLINVSLGSLVYRNQTSLKLICYYNFPSDFENLEPEDIPPNLCTHINLAFASISRENYSLQISSEGLKAVSKVSLFKLQNENLKLIISVGGAGNNNFSPMIYNHSRRKLFINSTMRFIKKFKLDGVDLDWEWPAGNGDKSEKVKFIQLLQEFREEFNNHKKYYILSIAAGVLESEIKMSYYVNYIAQYVDFVNLMTYDYHFYMPYYPITDHNAPLYATAKDKNSFFSTMNINFSVNNWISLLMPREKIVLGLPAYGHTYRLISSLNHDIHAPANGFGSIGENGFIKYYEVCDFLKNANTIQDYDDDSKVPYAYNNYNWISYDDEDSIETKAQYILSEKLGGAMVYSLNSDDHFGSCRRDKTKFPLTQKVSQVDSLQWASSKFSFHDVLSSEELGHDDWLGGDDVETERRRRNVTNSRTLTGTVQKTKSDRKTPMGVDDRVHFMHATNSLDGLCPNQCGKNLTLWPLLWSLLECSVLQI